MPPQQIPPFTVKQGQYLAFIYYYSRIHGRPPAESDFQRFFRVTPPVVHQMIKALQAHGFIDREPGARRQLLSPVDDNYFCRRRVSKRECP
jgi:Mn-dependent DtxR family transcriptional regulator